MKIIEKFRQFLAHRLEKKLAFFSGRQMGLADMPVGVMEIETRILKVLFLPQQVHLKPRVSGDGRALGDFVLLHQFRP